MSQATMARDLFQWAIAEDRERLSRQQKSVLQYLQANDRVTLHDLAVYSGGSEAGCSARIRELRNQFGYDIKKERAKPKSGLYLYWLVKQ